MKILKLTIKNKSEKIIREVEFEESGLSIIYGNVNKPNDDKETSNSIGKTLFLKFVDYIFGANESSEIVKSKIHGWTLDAVVRHENSEKNIVRILGSSDIEVDGEKYSLNDYKDNFHIERSFYRKQIFLKQKHNLIGDRSEPNKEDYISILKLLELSLLSDKVNEYYTIQDNIKEMTKLEKKFASFFNNKKISEIEQKIFLLNKEIDEKEVKLSEIESRISNLQFNEEKQDLMDDYADKNYAIKLLQAEFQKLRIEKKRLDNSINELDNKNITSGEIKKLYEKASFELPDLVVKRLEEVEKFHENVFVDRKKMMESRSNEIEIKMIRLDEKIDSLEKELLEIGNIISENEAYKESIAFYKDVTDSLQKLRYEQGEMSKFGKLIKERKDEEDELANKYIDLKQKHEENLKNIEEYQNFIYDLIPKIYTEDVNAYFSVSLKNRHKRNRPLAIELSLNGDTGEGVGEVRKILIDLLIFNFNNLLEFLIQDSSCFSGIDNRQVTNLIKLGHEIGIEQNKQYIISLNDYQVNKNDKTAVELIKSKTKLDLDENNKLLKINF